MIQTVAGADIHLPGQITRSTAPATWHAILARAPITVHGDAFEQQAMAPPMVENRAFELSPDFSIVSLSEAWMKKRTAK